MKVVIEIPEFIYNTLIETGKYGYYRFDAKRAIKNGTPLPKGHGRTLIVLEDIIKKELISLDFSCQKWISEIGLSNATLAIIEADKAESY